VKQISTSVYKLTIWIYNFTWESLLWYFRLKLIIVTKNLIGYQGDVTKQDTSYIILQQKIELDQKDIDILWF